MKTKGTNTAASVRQRLLNLAHDRKWEFHRVLARYGVERLLFRLAASPERHKFILKGATLFTVWQGMPHRSTKDLDLLGLERGTVAELVALFREVMKTPVEADGLIFHEVTGEPIRSAMEVGGVRLILSAELASARVPVQVDIGFGDSVVPSPVEIEFPTLLLTEKPRLHAYPPETVIAEKLEAIVKLGLANTRMKDFFDLWHLSRTCSFNASILTEAIAATFKSRGSQLPVASITGLSSIFGEELSKQTQWSAFVRQAAIAEEVPSLMEVVEHLAVFFEPLVKAAKGGELGVASWTPGGGW